MKTSVNNKNLKFLLEYFIWKETGRPYTTERSRAIDMAHTLIEYLRGQKCKG